MRKLLFFLMLAFAGPAVAEPSNFDVWLQQLDNEDMIRHSLGLTHSAADDQTLADLMRHLARGKQRLQRENTRMRRELVCERRNQPADDLYAALTAVSESKKHNSAKHFHITRALFPSEHRFRLDLAMASIDVGRETPDYEAMYTEAGISIHAQLADNC